MSFSVAFDRVYNPVETAYIRFINKLVHRSKSACMLGLILVALAIFGLTRIPTGFIPLEDQGYMVINVMLPDGASLERTDAVLEQLRQKIIKD